MEHAQIENVNFLTKNEKVHISDDLYYDLLDRWAMVDHGNGRRLFVKHCRFQHPIKRRFMIMQIMVANYKAGIRWEGIFEGRSHLSNWVSMEYSQHHKMEIPKINLCNGNFAPTELEYDNAKLHFSYLSLKNAKVNPEILYRAMDYHKFASLHEINIIKNLSESFAKNILPIEIE